MTKRGFETELSFIDKRAQRGIEYWADSMLRLSPVVLEMADDGWLSDHEAQAIFDGIGDASEAADRANKRYSELVTFLQKRLNSRPHYSTGRKSGFRVKQSKKG